MPWNLRDDFMSDSGRPFVIPFAGLLVGASLLTVETTKTVGKLVLYFGAQSFMNMYMGWVMRTSVTLEAGTFISATNTTLERDLTGCPAGFALTAMQQVISFFVFMLFFSAVYFTPYRYVPKRLESWFEVFCVIIFGCVFALNIALNNFSLGYISIAVNLIIRSCLPLSTFLSQQGLALLGLYPFKPCKLKEILLMVVGVLCAGVFTLARWMADKGSEDSENMVLGVVVCIASLLCGSLNLALAGVLGETKLNVYDTVAYMAIPATLFLLPIAFVWQKPVPGEWSIVFGEDRMTDWEILRGVWAMNKRTICWLVLSGVFSFLYNIIQFSIVLTLSPSATAFGGNFNKAALIFLTMSVPGMTVHKLPGSPYIEVIWSAIVVNIAAFSYYSYLQIRSKQESQEEEDRLREARYEDGKTGSEDSEGETSASEESSILGKFKCCGA
mmetsp:Transcript_60778/g.199032  ORF Transcript_60778/g.199032 Transcript_60778/m.199032 type:complete len:442 (-) Transcript_60778:16-1341(-)